ncbi:MAG TPA: class I SAM-dependent methyltransferase [Acidisoma sp.]|uniref:class I SAM-dependent methyltransferase n=1 Tax=Acidisoma sp. TaxID=1872115 RepID=UPI002BA60E65|nr:class I SAM-dependent methyltransferase [Acidisoma sp.]HTH99449.1 class I SAM-dependent methyltransferase [Acidisoma sp.]
MSVNDSFSDRHEMARGDGAAADSLCLSQASFWSPAHIVESAWHEHGPFAFWLIDQIRPRNFVELGTHNGFSYFCVCQTVQRLGLATACYAVDSWEGDDHAGFYGSEVFQSVSAINEAHYSGISTLMKSFFSDALPYFPDNSLDLLHIDGRHGYEDVVEDFESWQPKLSDRGVVLFHDTNVREREFGVWRLWDRLKSRYPSFEFLHGHGLGVLAVGPEVPEGLRPLVYATETERAAIQQAYARLGRATSLQFDCGKKQADLHLATQAADEVAQYVRHLEDDLALKSTALADLEQATRTVEETARQQEAELRQALADQEQMLVAREQELAGRLQQAQAVSDEIASHLVALQGERRVTDGRIAHLEGQAVLVPALRSERDQLRRELDTILTSAFWKRTDPWRRRLAAQPGLRRFLLRSAKLLWWSVTLQLAKRLRQRREIIQAGREAASPPDAKEQFTAAARADLAAFLASDERLSFPVVEQPDISAVIVVWNSAHLTLRCLRALQAAEGPSLEIIIFDNGSSDETGALLDRTDGIRVIRSKDNLGFLLGSNRGAELATGRAILLLNSDAFVRPDTLAVALNTLESAPDIGAVGARLLLPSGRLQEAGSIIWSDGSCLGYARGAEAEAFEGMFRREVDYCSGAFLLTPRALWTKLGGLEEAFAPAYYEETDFCMRMQEAGYRIIYEPAAVVDHFEFGSEAKSGESTAAMVRNQALFKSRHEAVLQRKHLPPHEDHILSARTAASYPRPRLLVIDNEVPLGAGGAGYPRARELLGAAVRAGWSVTLFPLYTSEIEWKTVRAEIAMEVEIVNQYSAPRFIEYMQERRGYYDVIMISRPDNMMLIRGFLANHPDLFDGARIIYDSEALAATREIAKAKFYGVPVSDAQAGAMIAEELALANDVDAIVCVNEAEAEAFRSRGVPVHVLTHAIESAGSPPPWRDRAGFLFIGRLMERDSPNWLGIAWFIREVWPTIRKSVPNATLTVLGRLHPEHDALDAPGVRLQGPVSDLGPLYDASRVFVAPVHFSAGVPLKVIEAAAAGLPVVGTHLMARQLLWQPEIEIGAADTAADFARACIALYNDEVTWSAMQTASQTRARVEYGPEVFEACVRKILA